MANRDGTGPVGDGSVEGRGLGICTGINGDRNEGGPRQGLARKKGFGHGHGRGNRTNRGQIHTENR